MRHIISVLVENEAGALRLRAYSVNVTTTLKHLMLHQPKIRHYRV